MWLPYHKSGPNWQKNVNNNPKTALFALVGDPKAVTYIGYDQMSPTNIFKAQDGAFRLQSGSLTSKDPNWPKNVPNYQKPPLSALVRDPTAVTTVIKHFILIT